MWQKRSESGGSYSLALAQRHGIRAFTRTQREREREMIIMEVCESAPPPRRKQVLCVPLFLAIKPLAQRSYISSWQFGFSFIFLPFSRLLCSFIWRWHRCRCKCSVRTTKGKTLVQCSTQSFLLFTFIVWDSWCENVNRSDSVSRRFGAGTNTHSLAGALAPHTNLSSWSFVHAASSSCFSCVAGQYGAPMKTVPVEPKVSNRQSSSGSRTIFAQRRSRTPKTVLTNAINNGGYIILLSVVNNKVKIWFMYVNCVYLTMLDVSSCESLVRWQRRRWWSWLCKGMAVGMACLWIQVAC